MNGFTLHLFAADRYERIDAVTSFVGEDASGSFGLLARHDRFMTVLTFGLARLRPGGRQSRIPGISGRRSCISWTTQLRISTRRYLRDTDVRAHRRRLGRELLQEEQALAETRRKLHRLEAEMLRRLAQLERD